MSAFGDIAKELMSTVARLSALETRTADAIRQQDRIEAKLDSLIDRLARIEADYKNLQTNVKNEVLNQIIREVTTVQTVLKLQSEGKLPSPSAPDGPISLETKSRS